MSYFHKVYFHKVENLISEEREGGGGRSDI